MSKTPAAFTLVELLVVIAIIGILVALLLPAVQAARESARSLQCLNHLKQIGLALHEYESARGCLPPAGLVASSNSASMYNPNFRQRSGPQIGWIVLALPFLEEQALYDRFDLSTNGSIFGNANDPQSHFIDVLTCPSAPATGRYFRSTLSSNKPFAKANYAAYVSPQHIGDLQFVPGALGGFVPGNSGNRGQRFRKIRDGTARTIAVTEILTTDLEWDHRGAWSLPWGGSSLLCVHIDHDFRRFGQSPENQRSVAQYYPDAQFVTWAHLPNTMLIADILFSCVSPAEARRQGMPCVAVGGDWSSSYVTSAPRSRHRGGVNTLMLDDHVGFLSDDIDASVLSRLVSINDQVPLNIEQHVR